MSSTFALSRHATEEHLRLAPPRQGRWLGPVGLALVAHGLLLVALTWGVGWKQEAPPTVFEAELWSRLPVEAAPRAVEPPAQPTPPLPPPAPEPVPVAKVTPPRPAPTPPGPSDAAIATQQAKKKAAAAQREQDKEYARKKAAADKALADQRALEDKKAADKKASEKKAAELQRKKEQQAAEAKQLEQQRQDNLRRMMGQAGASGGPAATGKAQQASGPSPGYGGRVAARIRPNVVFTESIAGNPRAEVEVHTLPDGTITSRRIVKSSGNADWDEAVLKAIDRTATLPRDTDGRVPSSLIIGLRPQD